MERLNLRVTDKMSVTIEAQDVREVVRRGAFWSELPSECPLCKAGVVLMHRTPKDNEYFGMQCVGYPRHETNFGIFKDSSRGLYYKREWHLAFQGGQQQQEGDQNYSGPPQGQQYSQQTQYQPASNEAPQYQPQPQYQQAPPPQPVNPVAQNLTDMITSRQLGMIRAIAREAGLHSDDESKALFGCNADQLSKRAASDYIEHLQKVQLGEKARLTYPPQPVIEAQVQQMAATQPVGADGTAGGAPPQPLTGSAVPTGTLPPPVQPQPGKVFKGPPVGTEQHGGMCRCPECSDIPF